MAKSELTEQQRNFIETFITIPFLLGRDKAREKRKEWAGEFESFNDSRDKVKARVESLPDGIDRSALLGELARTEASLVEGDGKPDFGDATKRLEMVESAVAIQNEHESCKALVEGAKAGVAAALALKPENAGEIQASFDLAADQARKGAMNHDPASFTACRDTLKALSAQVDEAQDNHAAVQAALAALAIIGDELDQARKALAADLGGELTSPLREQADRITDLIASAAGGSRSVAEAAQKSATAALATFKTDGAAAVEDFRGRGAALEKLTAASAALVAARSELAKDFGGALPAPLGTKADEIAAALKDAEKGDSKAILAAAADATGKIGELETTGSEMRKGRPEWIAAKRGFEAVFNVLANHPRKDDPVFVAGLYQGIEAARKKAEEQFNCPGATKDMASLPERCRQAISVADDVAEYDAKRADREKRTGTLPDPGTVTEGAPRDKVTEVKGFYDDAVDEFEQGKADKDVTHIARAVALLNKIPEGQKEAADLVKYAGEYEAAFATRAQDKVNLAGWNALYKEHLAPEMALFGTMVDAAKLADDKAARSAAEYRAAAVKLTNMDNFLPVLLKKADRIDDYLAAYQNLKDRIAEIDGITEENGKDAVADYLLKMKSDKTFAKARFVDRDYAAGIQAADNTKDDLEGKKKLADIAKDYLARKKTVETKVAQVKADGGGDADDAAASIETLINAAKDEATAKHWQEALDLIKKAQDRVTAVEAVGSAVKGLNADWADVSGLAPDAAHAKFMVLHDKVDGDDDENLFSTELAVEKKDADAALADAKGGGDAGAAAKAISEALTQVFWIGQQLAHREAYKALYDVVKQAHEVDLIKPEINKDNVLDWYINHLGDKKDEAKALADPPQLNFPEALKVLADAEREIIRAEQISKDWNTLRDTLVNINDVASTLGDTDLDGNFATEKARLEKYSADIGAEIPEGKFEKVRALVKEGGALAESLAPVRDKYFEVKGGMRVDIDPMRPKITEAKAPHAKDTRIQVARMDLEITDLMKAKAADAAYKVYDAMFYVIHRGLALDKLGVEYFTLRDKCADTLRDYDQKNSPANQKVTKRLEELNQHFEGGSIFDEPGDLKSEVSTWEASQNFNGGIKRLKSIPDECAKLDDDIKAYDTCKTQRDKSGEAIGQVLKKATGDIAPIATRLRSKHQNAVSIMDAGNYDLALKMFEELEADAAKATKSAVLIESFLGEIVELEKAVGDDKLETKVASAKARIAKLRESPVSMDADKELKAAEKAIGEAEDALGKNVDTVKDGVALAIKELADALKHIELIRQLDTAAGYARDQLVKLGEHGRKNFIEADIAEQNLKIEAQLAKARDRSSTTDMVMNELEEVMAAVHKIRRVADNYQEFTDLKKKVDDGMLELEKSETRYAVSDALPEIRKHLADAVDQAEKREHLDAIAALRRAQIDLSAASLEAKLEKGDVPSEDEINAILSLPAGDKKLDRIIADLDPKAQRGVLLAVLKVRFGCDVEVLKKSPETVDAEYDKWLADTNTKPDAERLVEFIRLADETKGATKTQYESWVATNGGATDTEKLAKLTELAVANGDVASEKFTKWLSASNDKPDAEKKAKHKQLHDDNVEDALDETGPNLLKLYDVMTECPNSDTLDNDSMLVLSTSGGKQTGSSYLTNIGIDDDTGDVFVTKKVIMREGEVGDSGFYRIALPYELDEIEDDCKPVDADPLSFFSWNTLHEVGHAVDDKLRAMKGGGNARAGWEEHGANVLPIAKEAAKDANYGYDESYIAAYLSGVSDPPIPEAPDPDKAEEWERKRLAVRNWVDMIREPQKPWGSASVAKATKLSNGRVYQESYTNDWTSYDYVERKKGVSGYQFRAPGEWFSELYAAFHSGKMNPKHPHHDWIRSI